MLNNPYFSVPQAQRELEDEGISVTTNTIRGWCKKHGFGFQIVPNGAWYIPRANLARRPPPLRP
jgi:hypothetical protein